MTTQYMCMDVHVVCVCELGIQVELGIKIIIIFITIQVAKQSLSNLNPLVCSLSLKRHN